MYRHLVVWLALVAGFASPRIGNTEAPKDLVAQRKKFVLAVIERLNNDKAIPADVKKIQAAYNRWSEGKNSDKLWNELNALIYDTSKNARVPCDVTIKTLKGDKEVRATIKYKLSGKPESTTQTTKDPSTCKERMHAGEFNIWAEENGKPISDKDARYRIWDRESSITLTAK